MTHAAKNTSTSFSSPLLVGSNACKFTEQIWFRTEVRGHALHHPFCGLKSLLGVVSGWQMWIQARGRNCPRSMRPHTYTHVCAMLCLGSAACASRKALSRKTGVQPGITHEIPPGPELSTRSDMDCIKALICQISWHLARLVYTLMSLGESFLLLKRLLAFSCRRNAKRVTAGFWYFLRVPVGWDQCHR